MPAHSHKFEFAGKVQINGVWGSIFRCKCGERQVVVEA